MKKSATLLLGLCLSGASGLFGAAPTVPENTVLFYGNALVERLLEDGDLEARLQLAHPKPGLQVRSLAWTGDEIGYRLRPEGYTEHLKNLLASWPAKTVVIGYGNNEAFGGEAGLEQFRKDWEIYLREISRLHPAARLVLLSPIAVQASPGVDPQTRNRQIQAYSNVIEQVAAAHGALFVDLFSASLKAYAQSPKPLTTQGIHLTTDGIRAMAAILSRAMLGDAAADSLKEDRVREVAKAAAQKAGYVADIVRPKNGVVYYGVRKRQEEYDAEIPRYYEIIEQGERIIHDLLVHPGKSFADYPAPSLPALPEGKTVPDRYSGGILKDPEEQQKDLTVADGYTLNCFASEKDFPDLKAPVQVAFDARGRLWVVTMPSFPHTLPGSTPNDKILILEDADHDGKADKCTVFAEGFDALDGVAFHEDGVIVSAQPRLLLLRDTDGDGRADSRVELLRGVDVTDSHHGGMVATDPLGQVIFSDGVFHRSQFETPFGVVRAIDSTTYRLNLGTGRIHTEWQGLTPNPWKTTFDRYGNLFQRFGGGHVLDGLPQTWTPLGIYQPYGNGTTVNYGKGSAASVVSSPNFPDKYQQGVVSAALLGSYCVSISAPNIDTGTVVGVDRLDLLTSQNSAFRPVDTAFGMDGALYVSDFSSRIIGHAQHPMRDPQWNHTLGRIWRVVAKDRPVIRDWPRIEGAPVAELLGLLTHSQDLVREHVRIELRKSGPEIIPAIDTWLAGLNKAQPGYEQALLEAVWVLEAKGQARLNLLKELMLSPDPRMRAAAVETIRFEARHLPEALAFLTTAARDIHPRVRMAVVHVVSHLRATEADSIQPAPASHGAHEGHSVHAGSPFPWTTALEGMSASEPAILQMLADLKTGVKPTKGRSIPVLEVNPATRVAFWLQGGGSGPEQKTSAAPAKKDKGGAKPAAPSTRLYRSFVEADTPQTVILSVKHGYVDISANGVQLLSADSPYSSQQQVQFELQKGLNILEITFRRLKPKGEMPPVFVYDTVGQLVGGARFAEDDAALKNFAATWEKAHAADANALKVQAVVNLMQFTPKELRVKAGQPVRLVFENPDLMQHNLVVVAPGADEEVGGLADQMAAKPDGATRNFVPDSNKILHATPLVNPNGRAELKFTAPAQPGLYPYLCTFPGHWRVMRGVLVVE